MALESIAATVLGDTSKYALNGKPSQIPFIARQLKYLDRQLSLSNTDAIYEGGKAPCTRCADTSALATHALRLGGACERRIASWRCMRATHCVLEVHACDALRLGGACVRRIASWRCMRATHCVLEAHVCDALRLGRTWCVRRIASEFFVWWAHSERKAWL